MGLNFSALIYQLAQDEFSVPCTFFPYASQPVTGVPFLGRGIYNTGQVAVPAEDGSVYSDHRTIFDIRTIEYATLPQQGDHVVIPLDCNDEPLGEFEIVDVAVNGGGEMTLTLNKWHAG
jgi:hypothetical protein